MAHYFTADTHFGDDPIRRFFGRPFGSAGEMDAEMIIRAAHLLPDDDLWVLGDFAACQTDTGRQVARSAFAALPGRKHLIRGNHDPDWLIETLPWASVHDLFELDAEGRRFVLCHYPLITWNGVRSGVMHLFGHVHTRWRGAEGQVNVAVDVWDFAPVGVDQVELAALTMPPSRMREKVEGEGWGRRAS